MTPATALTLLRGARRGLNCGRLYAQSVGNSTGYNRPLRCSKLVALQGIKVTAKSSLIISAKPVGVGAVSQPWILAGEQSSLLMRIAISCLYIRKRPVISMIIEHLQTIQNRMGQSNMKTLNHWVAGSIPARCKPLNSNRHIFARSASDGQRRTRGLSLSVRARPAPFCTRLDRHVAAPSGPSFRQIHG
jgi:hypothetical protein